MPRELANIIDALIPGIIGLFLIISPRIFTKSSENETKIRKIGTLLVGVSIIYALVKVFTLKNG